MTTAEEPQTVFAQLADALSQELALLNKGRTTMTIFGGHRTGTFAGRTYYRFEIPEEILLRTVELATFTFGRSQPLTIEGNVITVENQFMTVALPQDFGPNLPEVQIAWSYERQLQPTILRLKALGPTATIPRLLLEPGDSANTHAVPFDAAIPDQTPPDQISAVQRVLKNRISLVWGPILSGKTRVLGMIAANYLKGGKSVLFVAPSNDQVDETFLRAVAIGGQLGVDMKAVAARYDLPSLVAADDIAPYSFEQQVEDTKSQKRRVFLERVNLLKQYWDVRVKQILHEDFYLRTQAMRDTVASLRKKIDEASKEVVQAQKEVANVQNASLIDRVKKGFSKDDLVAAQKAVVEKQQHLKHLQQLQKRLSNEITSIELEAPVTAEETKAYNAAVARIEELGGMEKVSTAVEEFVAVDEPALLKEKRFIATSVATARMDPVIAGRQFDMVIVDDAQVINLPTLVALSAMAKEKLVVGGDPYQIEPDALLNNDAGRQWLQRDIFLTVAGTDQLNQLFDWAEKNKAWSIVLSSHFATTPKLSLFVGSAVFDDKINVYASPKARGRIIFVDTTGKGGMARQYVGKKRILPFNEAHTEQVVACVKHAFMEGGRTSGEIGVILPFAGPTLYTKQRVRMAGIRNVEVGTPYSFRGRRKKAIIFDTTMAGVDHTMRPIDDRKAGEHRIVRLLNTVFSCVEEDLYIVADIGHFRSMYKDRLLTKFLLLLQSQADLKHPVFTEQVRAFDNLDLRERKKKFSIGKAEREAEAAEPAKPAAKEDVELKLQMKMMAKKETTISAGDEALKLQQDILAAAERALGLRMDINLLSLYTGGDLLFRSSHATDIAAEKIPRELVASDKEFQRAMEYWNLLIYDMSGGSKTDHPLLIHKGPESKARQDIRNLRAFYSSDVSAVISEGKNKIAVEVSKIFQDLLGKAQPNSPADWSNAYLRFLGRLEAYLGWISEQIRR